MRAWVQIIRSVALTDDDANHADGAGDESVLVLFDYGFELLHGVRLVGVKR